MKTAQGISRLLVSSPRACVLVTLPTLLLTLMVLAIVMDGSGVAKCALAVTVLTVAFVAYFTPDWALCIVERIHPEVVWRIPTAHPFAALTIDDVPILEEPSHFEQILDVLARFEVKATFFVMSGFDMRPEEGGPDDARRRHCRQLLLRAVREGHELGNHMQFNWPCIAMKSKDFERAFDHCDRVIAGLQGGQEAWRARSFRWFRPASGMWTSKMLAFARAKGYTTVLGNCFPFDHCSVSRFANVHYYRCRARSGCILIMHDRWHSPKTLAEALPTIVKSGLKLMTLSQLQSEADEEDQTSSNGDIPMTEFLEHRELLSGAR